jgi:hypothetical protein
MVFTRSRDNDVPIPVIGQDAIFNERIGKIRDCTEPELIDYYRQRRSVIAATRTFDLVKARLIARVDLEDDPVRFGWLSYLHKVALGRVIDALLVIANDVSWQLDDSRVLGARNAIKQSCREHVRSVGEVLHSLTPVSD